VGFELIFYTTAILFVLLAWDSSKLSPHFRRLGGLIQNFHWLGMPSKTPYFVLQAFDDLIATSVSAMRVIIYALTIKLESKCGLFQSFSFIILVRITRFPRESLADFCSCLNISVHR